MRNHTHEHGNDHPDPFGHDDAAGPAYRGPDGPGSWSHEPAFPPLSRAWAWFEGHRRTLLTVGVAFQLFVLLGMVATLARPHIDTRSRVVLLRVLPVDPRDLLRGDYVILSYDVSRPGSAASGLLGESGKTVYVALAPDPDGRHYHDDGVAEEPFDDGRPFLRGTVTDRGLIRYGIESYYVQEGTGHDYEAAVRDRRLSAEVIIGPDGVAALRGLVIE